MKYYDILTESEQAKAMAKAAEGVALGAGDSGTRYYVHTLETRKEAEAKKIWEKKQAEGNDRGIHINNCTGLNFCNGGNSGEINVGVGGESPLSNKKRGSSQHVDEVPQQEQEDQQRKRIKLGGGTSKVSSVNKSFKLSSLVPALRLKSGDEKHQEVKTDTGNSGGRNVDFSQEVMYVEKTAKKSQVTTMKERLAATEDLEEAKFIGNLALNRNAHLCEHNLQLSKDQDWYDREFKRLRKENDRLRKERNEARDDAHRHRKSSDRYRRERDSERREVRRLSTVSPAATS